MPRRRCPDVGHLVGHDIFLDFIDEVFLVVRLDDALDGAIDWFFKKISDFHDWSLYSSILKAR